MGLAALSEIAAGEEEVEKRGRNTHKRRAALLLVSGMRTDGSGLGITGTSPSN